MPLWSSCVWMPSTRTLVSATTSQVSGLCPQLWSPSINCTTSTLSDLFSCSRAAILSINSGRASCLAVLMRLRSFSLAEKWYNSERTNGCRSRMDAANVKTSWVYPTEASSQTLSRHNGRLTNTRATRREIMESRKVFALRIVHARGYER